MHPARSVILFTTLSGLGFGLLFWLGIGLPRVSGMTAFIFFTLAYLLAVGGLLASTFHLGHPERALRAFTQWRTSWLSREAWASVVTLVVMAIFGAGLVFLDTRWTMLGLVGALLSLGTVGSTAMIYTQLRTVPRWRTPLTPILFLTFAVAGGALLAGQITSARWLLVLTGTVQLAWWLRGDDGLSGSGTDMASATGLGKIGQVRAFEPPHTGTNYLLREMVYVVGRKHAQKLRIIAMSLGFVVPLILLLIPFSHVLAGVAVVSMVTGMLVSRWLFFAEAEHVVGLYYGRR